MTNIAEIFGSITIFWALVFLPLWGWGGMDDHDDAYRPIDVAALMSQRVKFVHSRFNSFCMTMRYSSKVCLVLGCPGQGQHLKFIACHRNKFISSSYNRPPSWI